MDINQTEAAALNRVLSLAENHQMWNDPLSQSPSLKEFTDETYEAIQEVRRFLKKHGVMTTHEWLQQATKKTFERMSEQEQIND
jgi:phage-related protein